MVPWIADMSDLTFLPATKWVYDPRLPPQPLPP